MPKMMPVVERRVPDTLYWTLEETDFGPVVTLWEPLNSVRWWRFGINRRYRFLRCEYWFKKYEPTPADCARSMLRRAKREAQARIEMRQRYDAYREPQPLDWNEEE